MKGENSVNKDLKMATDALWIAGVNIVNSMLYQSGSNDFASFLKENEDNEAVMAIIAGYGAIINALSKIDSKPPKAIFDSWKKISTFMEDERLPFPDEGSTDTGSYFLIQAVEHVRKKEKK